MRIKPIEMALSVVFAGLGVALIWSGRAITAYGGYEVPLSLAYVELFVGIAIPVLAWFLRSPSRNKDKPDE